MPGLPVGQAGQGVEGAQLFQQGFRFLVLGQVHRHGDVVADGALAVFHGDDGEQAGVDVAALAPVPDFPFPAAVAVDLLPHGGVESLVVAARLEQTRVFAQHLLPAVAVDAGEGLIHLDDAEVGVGDEDGFDTVAEDLGRQVQVLFRLLLAAPQLDQQGGGQGEGDQHGQGVEDQGPLGFFLQGPGAGQEAAAQHLLELPQGVDAAGGQVEPLFRRVADGRLLLAGGHGDDEAADAFGLDHEGFLADPVVGRQGFRVGQLAELLQPCFFHRLDAVIGGHAQGAEIFCRKHGGDQGPFLAGHFLGLQEKDEGQLLAVDPAYPADAHGGHEMVELRRDEGGVTVHHRLPGEAQLHDPGPQLGEGLESLERRPQGRIPVADGVEPFHGAVGEVVLGSEGSAEALAAGGDVAAGETPLLLQFVNQLADFNAGFRPAVDQPGALPLRRFFPQVVGRQGGNGEKESQQQPQGLALERGQGQGLAGGLGRTVGGRRGRNVHADLARIGNGKG